MVRTWPRLPVSPFLLESGMSLHLPSSIFCVSQFSVASQSSQNVMVGSTAMTVEVRAAETPRRRQVLRCMAVVWDNAGQIGEGLKLECLQGASIYDHLLTCSIHLCPNSSLWSGLYSGVEPEHHVSVGECVPSYSVLQFLFSRRCDRRNMCSRVSNSRTSCC